MSNTKEIRTKIKSIESTKKITKAMQMVAASKMRKAQDRMFRSRPYLEKIEDLISHVSSSQPEYKHPLTIEREVKKSGFIVVSSDRGLCGGLNINLFKDLIEYISEKNKKNIEIDFAAIGQKAYYFLLRNNLNIVAKVDELGDEPILKDLIGIITVMLEKYENKEIDELYVVYNGFVNTMSQAVQIKRFLPIVITPRKIANTERWDYIYEPSAEPLFKSLFDRYIESLIYQAVVENVACEQASRMIAMRSATENGDELINEFNLLYNKARQSAITRELSEIVAGAAAV